MTYLGFAAAAIAAAVACLPGTASAQSDDFRVPGAPDYCKADTVPSTIMVLVDRSAAYRPEDHERLIRGLGRLMEEIPPDRVGTRIDIRSVTDVSSGSARIFSGCVPACKETAFKSCDPLPIQFNRRIFWEEMQGRLTLNELGQVPPVGLETALAETIERATRGNKPARLVIFSDFLEYHRDGGKGGLPAISFYSAAADFNGYLAALAKGNYLPDLRAVKVSGFGLGEELGGGSNLSRRRPLDPAVWTKVYRFWTGYLQQAGAEGFSISQEYPGTVKPPPPGRAPPPDRVPRN